MIRRAAAIACGLLAALALVGCTGGAAAPRASGPGASPHAPASPAPSAAPAAPAPLQHIVVIMDENKPAQSVIGSVAAPYLTGLARKYAQASHYSAITHPSLPNYLAVTSGTTAGITSDCNPPGGRCLDTGANLAEELDAAGRSWKMYAESMPAPCSTTNTGLYAVKHNPFLYFPSVTRSAAYCRAHDVPYDQLAVDLASAHTLPDFSFISPNLCDDMHDCSVAAGDRWLSANVPRILASPAFSTQRSLLVITFDEGDAADNVVPCVFAGPAARRGTTVSTPFTHYSLLRTIEKAWGLPAMTANDANSAPMSPLLR
jgi:phospholipase C